jgi:hypothetical protein
MGTVISQYVKLEEEVGRVMEDEADVHFLEHAIQIPEDKLPLLNRSSTMHMKKVVPEAGTGYKGLLEVFHQLHCLVSFAHQHFPLV